jgi:hypothetical protein
VHFVEPPPEVHPVDTANDENQPDEMPTKALLVLVLVRVTLQPD